MANRLELILSANAAELKRGIQEGVQATQQAGHQMGEAFSLAEAKQAVGELTAKLSEFGREAVAEAGHFAALKRSLAAAFSDAGAADNAFRMMRELAEGTNVSIDALVRGGKEMQRFGTLTRENLETSANLAAATGASFEEVAAVMARVSRGGEGTERAVGLLHRAFGIEAAHIVTMQAISGAGYPGVPSLDITDNVTAFVTECGVTEGTTSSRLK